MMVILQVQREPATISESSIIGRRDSNAACESFTIIDFLLSQSNYK